MHGGFDTEKRTESGGNPKQRIDFAKIRLKTKEK